MTLSEGDTENNKMLMTALQLATSYIDGFTSLKFIKEILEIQEKNVDKYLNTPEFLNHLYGVCYQSIIINLSNMLVDDKDTINIHYLYVLLLKMYETDQIISNSKDLLFTIKSIQECYSKESDFYLGLKELRDKYIAHIDKRRFHLAERVTRKISINQIDVAYNSIGKLVGKLIGVLALNPELLDFDMLEKAIFQFKLLTNT